jgi:nucleotide-binding universal stress UspA family protein
MKAVIGVDGSETGWEALRQAGNLLTRFDDRVVLYYAPPRIKSALSPDVAERNQAALAESLFAEAKKRLPASLSINAETVRGAGDPRKELVALADSQNADLIVVGARGLGPISTILLGSVSRAVARTSRRPVLVARPKADKQTEPVLKVLLPLDEVPASPKTIQFLNSVAWPPGALGRLMHVAESVFGDPLPEWLIEQAQHANDERLAMAYLQERETLKRSKYTQLCEYRNQLPRAFADAPPIVLDGYPAEQIIQTAQADDIDLIVIGFKEVSLLERFMLGSTSERVLAHAPCSVLLVHHH